MLSLTQGLALAEPLSAACRAFENDTVRKLAEHMQDERLPILAEAMQRVLHVDASLEAGPLQQRNQRVFAVRPGVHGASKRKRKRRDMYRSLWL